MLLQSYHFFFLRFGHHFHQWVLWHVYHLFAWRCFFYSCSRLFFWLEPLLPSRLECFLLVLPSSCDRHNFEEHSPDINSGEAMSFALFDIVIKLVGVRGRVEHISLEMLKVNISWNIVEDSLKTFWHFTYYKQQITLLILFHLLNKFICSSLSSGINPIFDICKSRVL